MQSNRKSIVMVFLCSMIHCASIFGGCAARLADEPIFGSELRGGGYESVIQPAATELSAVIQPTRELSMPSPVAPTPEPEPTPVPVYTANINIVGDLMVHQWQLDHAYDKKADSYDFDYCFAPVKEYLSAADYTVGNLETVLADKELGISDYPLFGTPDQFARALKNAGFDLLTTANNHSYDKGLAGVLRTIEVLDELALNHIGTYKTQEERNTVFIKEINNIRFAFLTYTYGTNGLKTPPDMPYLINLLDVDLIKDDIMRARALDPDFIIVLPHMGEEYRETPREGDMALIRLMLEAGADIVPASHPHVLQPMEHITVHEEGGGGRDCFVAYSLGNFVSSQRTLPRDAGIILNLAFEKTEGQKAKLQKVSYLSTWVSFINAKGVYDIRVLPVDDTLAAHNSGGDVNLRPKDIQRLENVQHEIDAKFQGQAVPLGAVDGEKPNVDSTIPGSNE